MSPNNQDGGDDPLAEAADALADSWTEDMDEGATERIQVWVKPSLKRFIEREADVVGVSQSSLARRFLTDGMQAFHAAYRGDGEVRAEMATFFAEYRAGRRDEVLNRMARFERDVKTVARNRISWNADPVVVDEEVGNLLQRLKHDCAALGYDTDSDFFERHVSVLHREFKDYERALAERVDEGAEVWSHQRVKYADEFETELRHAIHNLVAAATTTVGPDIERAKWQNARTYVQNAMRMDCAPDDETFQSMWRKVRMEAVEGDHPYGYDEPVLLQHIADDIADGRTNRAGSLAEKTAEVWPQNGRGGTYTADELFSRAEGWAENPRPGPVDADSAASVMETMGEIRDTMSETPIQPASPETPDSLGAQADAARADADGSGDPDESPEGKDAVRDDDEPRP